MGKKSVLITNSERFADNQKSPKYPMKNYTGEDISNYFGEREKKSANEIFVVPLQVCNVIVISGQRLME